MAVVNLSTVTDLFERTDTLKRYYEDIRKYKPMTRDEERRWFETYQNGTPNEKEKAKSMIANCNQRFVLAVAKRFATNDNILDLIEEGNIGLLIAMDNFNLKTGNKFISHAVWYIRREINKYLISNHTVRKSNITKTHHIISQATNKFIQEHNRQPLPEELLDYLDVNYNVKLNNANDVIDVKYLPIDMNYDSDDAVHGEDLTLYNQYTAEYQTSEKKSETDYSKILFAKLLNTLSKNEKTVVKMYFGIDFDKSYELQEIAEIMDYTKERVRQLKNSGVAKLKKAYKYRFDQI